MKTISNLISVFFLVIGMFGCGLHAADSLSHDEDLGNKSDGETDDDLASSEDVDSPVAQFTWCYVSPQWFSVLGLVFKSEVPSRFLRQNDRWFVSEHCSRCARLIRYNVGQFFRGRALCSACMRAVFGSPRRPKIFIEGPEGVDEQSAVDYWLTSPRGWLAYLKACDHYYIKKFAGAGFSPLLFLQAREDLEKREFELARQAVRDEFARRERTLRLEKLKELGTFLISWLCPCRP